MASFLNIGVSGLLAYQRVLNVTGHNIANVNTPGYSRQTADLATRPPTLESVVAVGSGVKVARIRRMYDDFLSSQVRNSTSVTSQLDTEYSHAKRIDNLLSNPDVSLDSALQGYFDAFNALSNDPSSTASRQLVMTEGESLTQVFHDLYQQYEDMRDSVRYELELATGQVNVLTSSIAQVNDAIVKSGGLDTLPNDLMDQRDQLLKELSEMVNISVVAQDNGALNVFVGRGQALVINNYAATMGTRIGSLDPTNTEITISYGQRTLVVTDQISGGKLQGLDDFQKNYLDSGQNQLGLVAVGLVSSINQQHVLGVDLYGSPGRDYFTPLSFDAVIHEDNTGTGAASLTIPADSIGDLTSSDYELVSDDGANLYTLTRLSDGVTWALDASLPIPTIDGFDLAITAGANIGDTFLVQPTRQGARKIQQALTDINNIAAAGSLLGKEVTDANGNALNTGNGVITNIMTNDTTGIPLAAPITLTFTNDADGLGNPGFTITNGPPAPDDFVLFDPALDEIGKSFPETAAQFAAFGDMSFQLSGIPSVGDQFVIENNTTGNADNRNALALAGIQFKDVLRANTASVQDAYSALVSDVGSKTQFAEATYAAQEGLLSASRDALLTITGVNLDEEAANLIRYQKSYQAMAQVFTVAGEVMDSLLNAVGR